jgi:hypothetical protein
MGPYLLFIISDSTNQIVTNVHVRLKIESGGVKLYSDSLTLQKNGVAPPRSKRTLSGVGAGVRLRLRRTTRQTAGSQPCCVDERKQHYRYPSG